MNIHKSIRDAVWISKPSKIHVTRKTAANERDRLRIKSCQMVKY
jgi:hypothetical protein